MSFVKSNNLETQKVVFKVLIVGDFGVGKTAIVKRYTDGLFSSTYKITFGAEFSVKPIRWDNTLVHLQLWDIAGHERYGYMTSVYYRNAVCCAVVFDVSRYQTYQSSIKWLSDLRERVFLEDGRDVPVILLANKWDIGYYCVSDETINRLCRDAGFKAWFRTSAKTNLNIDEAMNCLVESAMATWSQNKNKQKRYSILLHKQNSRSSCCS